MSVDELIALLSTYPADMPVFLWSNKTGMEEECRGTTEVTLEFYHGAVSHVPPHYKTPAKTVAEPRTLSENTARLKNKDSLYLVEVRGVYLD